MEIKLEKNSWQEAEELIKASKGTAIISVGSIEQHGYHLPIGTDSFVANFLAEEAAQKTGAILVPPLWFGWSPHHMALPGSISIRPEILQEYLFDVIESLANHGVDKFVLINGHRIVNVVWMQITAQKAQEKLGVSIRIFDPAYMSKEIVKDLAFGSLGHAEEIETSHMMYLWEELVHLDKAVDSPITESKLYSVDPSYPFDTLCYVPSTKENIARSKETSGGTSGEPSKADREKGKIYHQHLINNLIETVNSLRKSVK